jgi:hypothetical protein
MCKNSKPEEVATHLPPAQPRKRPEGDPNRCRRSARKWSMLHSKALRPAVGAEPAACTQFKKRTDESEWRARSYVSPHAVGLERMAAKKMFPAEALPPLQSATGERCLLILCKNERTPATATDPLLLLMGGTGLLASFLHRRQCVCPAPQSACQCTQQSTALDILEAHKKDDALTARTGCIAGFHLAIFCDAKLEELCCPRCGLTTAFNQISASCSTGLRLVNFFMYPE